MQKLNYELLELKQCLFTATISYCAPYESSSVNFFLFTFISEVPFFADFKGPTLRCQYPSFGQLAAGVARLT